MGKYYYNKDYFDVIDTEDKAYWLGFLYADGCIMRSYRNGKLKAMNLQLTLCREDRSHLQKFLDNLNGNIEIKDRKSVAKGKEYFSSSINVCSTKMCRDLINLGCTPQKTFNIRFPSDKIVPSRYKKDFLRGIFDGDGCISTSKDDSRIEVTFTGVFDMIKDISDFLKAEKILRTHPKIYSDKRSHGASFYIYGKDTIKEFLDYIYAGATVYLERKYQKYLSFYEGYDVKKEKRGVHFDNCNNVYVSTIYINGKRISTRHKNIDDAITVRKQAEIEKMNSLNCQRN